MTVTEATHAAAKPGRTGSGAKGQKTAESGRERTVLRLHPDVKQRAVYWAERRGYSSVNEYMADAVDEKIRRENLDYDLPTLEISRLNQLIDEIRALSTTNANLERVVTSLGESLLGMTRGDNYLMDAEDGELDG